MKGLMDYIEEAKQQIKEVPVEEGHALVEKGKFGMFVSQANT
ncbi:hypothetical protein [Hydrogenovibrio marinus]|nr:hypothetical protein [Hydrogenovibrio marinus]BBN59764.1 hypothetical protein HVMH_1358 [Hydrogenovibrio marinus]